MRKRFVIMIFILGLILGWLFSRNG